jgi:hypothetical protein
MNKVVSFSGGRTSAYLCKLMIDKFGSGNVDVVYMDTGAEHEETYEFIRKLYIYLKDRYGIEIIFLRGDFSLPLGKGVGYKILDIKQIGPDLVPYKEMMAKYGVPYTGGMFCTDRMKLKPFKKYCDGKYGKGNYEAWLGIRFDEPKRLWGNNPKYPLKSAYKQISNCGLDDYQSAILFQNIINGTEISNLGGLTELAKKLIADRIVSLNKEQIHYLAEISEYEKQDVIDEWSKMPFDLMIDEWSGNCEFCPKKSDLKLAASKNDSPKSYNLFVDSLHDTSVRVDDKTGHWSKMYRGEQSLEQLVATFDGSTGEEIKARMRGSKMMDTGSCSESCEVFTD